MFFAEITEFSQFSPRARSLRVIRRSRTLFSTFFASCDNRAENTA
jgi:hypothetical protein